MKSKVRHLHPLVRTSEGMTVPERSIIGTMYNTPSVINAASVDFSLCPTICKNVLLSGSNDLHICVANDVPSLGPMTCICVCVAEGESRTCVCVRPIAVCVLMRFFDYLHLDNACILCVYCMPAVSLERCPQAVPNLLHVSTHNLKLRYCKNTSQ